VPLLQYHFDISSFTTFPLCVTMSQSYNADSLGVFAIQLLCFICPAG
jgi:predicted class III extradiol MEMO1 family dioxygenase